jgi:hypothetical protein
MAEPFRRKCLIRSLPVTYRLPTAGWQNGVTTMRHRYHWLTVIWVVIGLVIAWTHAYITVAVLKVALSAVLGVVLWPLLLLGVQLHVS